MEVTVLLEVVLVFLGGFIFFGGEFCLFLLGFLFLKTIELDVPKKWVF